MNRTVKMVGTSAIIFLLTSKRKTQHKLCFTFHLKEPDYLFNLAFRLLSSASKNSSVYK